MILKVINTKEELAAYRAALPQDVRLGLVPTMGALHPGHISLIKRSLDDGNHTMATIFVNPKQFNDAQDLAKYPRTLSSDIEMLSGAGCHAVFCPEASDLYDRDYVQKNFDLGGLDLGMEGASRPGHFAGMMTVVDLLFTLIKPHTAYFGEKDFQQLAIIRRVSAKLHPELMIVGCPIYREPNGLAMSSRNTRLSEEGRKAAGFIYETMLAAKQHYRLKTPMQVAEFVHTCFQARPEYVLDYYQIVDAGTLQPIGRWEDASNPHACVAVIFEGVRLIDNLSFAG